MRVLSFSEELRTFLREGARYIACKVRRESYLEYQSRRYSLLWKRDAQHFSWADRTFQLDYCRSHGLQPSMRFLDYGCGPLAAGVHFVRYLDEGRYVGADISLEALQIGQRRLSDLGLTDRCAELVHLPASGLLRPLERFRFDFVWAQSVLTHMAPRSIAELLEALAGILSPGGVFYATFYLAAGGARRHGFKDWSYDEDFLVGLAARYGLQTDILDDCNHPRPIVHRNQTMAVARMRRAPSA